MKKKNYMPGYFQIKDNVKYGYSFAKRVRVSALNVGLFAYVLVRAVGQSGRTGSVEGRFK